MTERISRETYRAVMAIDPLTGVRTGLAQVLYGWLAPAGGWDAGEHDKVAIWSRRQSFWRRFG